MYETLTVAIDDGIARVALDRPHRANALDRTMWDELRAAFHALDECEAARVVVLSGTGSHFCAGIDLDMLFAFEPQSETSGASGGHARETLRRSILDLQDVFTSIERCRKPVLAAVDGVCVGAGLDLATACDLRYATVGARFAIREIDMGVVADIGVLQRMPKIVGEGVTRELAYTGREVRGEEAAALRLVNACFADRDALMHGVTAVALDLASKSPLTLRGTKYAIAYARDHTVADGLEQVATWNAATLQSDDFSEALRAFRARRAPKYRD